MENIVKRISTRNYLETALEPKSQATVKEIIHKEYPSIFGHTFDFQFVDQKFMKKNKVKRVGTYGVISGNPSYIFAGITDGYKSIIDYGYILELMVLELTGNDLQTCWLGGTFSRKTLYKLYKLSSEVSIPAIVAVGKKSTRKSFVQNLMGNNYHNRKDFETIFYDGEVGAPLKEEMAGAFLEPLEGLRLAPSDMNGQPWRVIKEVNRLHFYCATNQMAQMKYVDMGIGLSHFDYIRKKKGIEGSFHILELSQIKSMKYIISFIAS